MSNTDKAIDRIFKRLAATYGASWDRSLGQTPIGDIKTAWAHELSGFMRTQESMQSIAWALENLPEHCPNVIVFKNLCYKAPAVEREKLPEPKADPERIKAELAKLRDLGVTKQPQRTSEKDWAHRIISRHEGGEKIAMATLKMARTAIGLN